MNSKNLKEKILNKKAKICIVGLGYVGLPLVVEFAESGYNVTGIDTSKDKISRLLKGQSYIEDVKSSAVNLIIKAGKFHPTSEYGTVKNQDAIIICVPTPLRKTREPDLSYIVDAADEVVKYLSRDTLVILESTSYPGTTRDILLDKIEKKGFRGGVDAFVAFSPERVDPGNERFGIRNTPKVVGGIDKKSLNLAKTLYSQVVDRVVTVNSCEEAEMVKLLENTYRAVNIGLINEMTMLCSKFDLDIWNVIRAASTKPYGFMAFYPGPGLGGHCIPVDPQFLSWKAKSNLFYPRFIDHAEEINTSMPNYVAKKVITTLNRMKKSVNGSKILIMGVSYKKNVGDTRESPSFEVAQILKQLKAQLSYSDPYVASFEGIKRVPHSNINFRNFDCVLVITDHEKFDYKKMVREARAVVDCRGVTLDLKGKAKIVRI
ncbi:MAG: nucleotide sugar dehydrogenase [Elusimicrobia bacterium]|nr:nucleotide sugar dehydrogenase [Elusimicrobiota bacterium]